MGGKVWRVLLTLFVVGAMGCAASPPPITPPLPTPMATAVLPTVTVQPTIVPTTVPTTVPEPTETAVFSTAAAPVIPSVAAPTLPVIGAASVIGLSAGKRPLTAYQFGNGPNQVVLVGGIHGGYEWNTIVLAYRLIDYFAEQPTAIPETVTLHIIPSANPDGQFAVTGQNGRFVFDDVDLTADNFSGRMNDNDVDLNRNWDCNWQETALWREQEISAGTFPFSEPETVALRDFFLDLQPSAVIFLHSAANAVYGAGCADTYEPAYALATLYGTAAAYPVHESFDYYQVTGDASDWLALQHIPAISVELQTHEALDWEQNVAGLTAVLDNFSTSVTIEPTRFTED